MAARLKICPIETTLEVISNKWKPLILFYLLEDKRRFNEFRRHIPEISHQMLSQSLRQLESDGIIYREVYPEVPPRVEYSLTETGQSLVPILREMHQWGEKYLNGEFQNSIQSGDQILQNTITKRI